MGSNFPNFEESELVLPPGQTIPDCLKSRAKPYYVTRDETRLRVLLVNAATDKPRGSLIFSPGRTEFIEKYLESIVDFSNRGFTVFVVDPRGQGLSDRPLDDPVISFVNDFQEYSDDLGYAVKAFEPLLPKPHILLGHSMGGTIVLQSILSGVINPSAVITSAPMLGLFDLEAPVMTWIVKFLAFTGLRTKDLPFQKQRNGEPIAFEVNKLTSDPVRYAKWADFFRTIPRLRVGAPSFGWVSAAMKAMAYVNRNADKLKIPSLVVAAGADPIVDPASNRSFAVNSGSTFQIVPGALHELMMERDEYRDQFFAHFDKFLEENAL